MSDEKSLKNTMEIGIAGEWFAMFQLARRGYVASLAPRNAATIDILGSSRHGARSFSLQVKTASDVRTGWRLGKKHETLIDDRIFYCFVEMVSHLELLPKTWIVPSSTVAEHVTKTHQAWLTGLNLRGAAKGEPRKDNDGRTFYVHTTNPVIEEYQHGWLDQYYEAWHLLD